MGTQPLAKNTAKEILIRNYGGIIEHLAVFAPEAQNILIVSAEAQEGRTLTAISLGLTAALLKPNKRILLVDLDLRHSALHRMLGLDDTRGIREVIAKTLNVEDVVCSTHLSNLTVIPAGKDALDFPEAFQSEALICFLKEVKSQYDIVFYDSPAINNYLDVFLLSSLMDRVVMVIRSRISRALEVVSAKDAISRANGKVLGAILNDFHNPIPSFLAKLL